MRLARNEKTPFSPNARSLGVSRRDCLEGRKRASILPPSGTCRASLGLPLVSYERYVSVLELLAENKQETSSLECENRAQAGRERHTHAGALAPFQKWFRLSWLTTSPMPLSFSLFFLYTGLPQRSNEFLFSSCFKLKKRAAALWRRSTQQLCCSAATAAAAAAAAATAVVSSSERCACPWVSSTAPARRPTCSLLPELTRAGPAR